MWRTASYHCQTQVPPGAPRATYAAPAVFEKTMVLSEEQRAERRVSAPRYALMPTPLGAFGVAWTEAGIVRTWMHAPGIEGTRAQIRRSLPDATEALPPSAVATAMADVTALLAGEPRDVRSAPLDFRDVDDFDRRVYEVVRTIDPGSTLTYGDVARIMGEEPMQAREVGRALARNRFAPIVPCHRVVAAGHRLGGYTAPGGVETKRRLLELEGAAIVAPPLQGQLFGDAV
jgi:methylated-DNA-[protein]-cysteine S-methyltransferase